jgi:ABC-2 type transport system permease protein
MGKIGLIISREYLSRVKKKSFLLTTIGLPILFLGFSVLIGFITATSKKDSKIAVVDESNIFANKLGNNSKGKEFVYFEKNKLASLIGSYDSLKYDMLLHIKDFGKAKPDTTSIIVYSEGTLGLESSIYLNERLNSVYQAKIMADQGMSTSQIDSINNIEIDFKVENKDKSSMSSSIASAISGVMGFLIYLTLFIYGTMVMKGVMEEKTNRIAEVIVSSVRPFELMMGKVLGIGLVGLTQFAIWIILMSIIGTVASGAYLASGPGAEVLKQVGDVQHLAQASKGSNELTHLLTALHQINWLKLGSCFIFYFLGGYLLYASLFAAIGSMVNEDISDAQSLTLPVSMPIIVAFVIGMQTVQNPNSGIAVFGSIFPLTSPIVMLARLPYNPPTGQLLLSMALLIGAFIFTVFIAGKIYRTGILMYGKKLSWGDAIKWLRHKN